MANCPGGLILYADGTVADRTLDDDEDGCRGRELRHEGDQVLLGLDVRRLQLLRHASTIRTSVRRSRSLGGFPATR